MILKMIPNMAGMIARMPMHGRKDITIATIPSTNPATAIANLLNLNKNASVEYSRLC